jgi:hypothetical protein
MHDRAPVKLGGGTDYHGYWGKPDDPLVQTRSWYG